MSVILLEALHIFPLLIHMAVLGDRRYLPISQVRKLEVRFVALGVGVNLVVSEGWSQDSNLCQVPARVSTFIRLHLTTILRVGEWLNGETEASNMLRVTQFICGSVESYC